MSTRAERARRQAQSDRDRRQAQSDRDKERNRQEQADRDRRQAQSDRDKQRNRQQQARQQQLDRVHLDNWIRQHNAQKLEEESRQNAMSNPPWGTIPSASEMTEKKDPFLDGISRLFDDSTYSDLTVYLGKAQLKLHAHRMILGLRSPYFQVAFKNQMQEAITGEFRLPENDEHALWRVFQYMYTNDYDGELDRPSGAEGEDPQLLRHPRVYALADLFRIEELKKLSVQKFKAQMKNEKVWTGTCEAFADCIREVYTSTPDPDFLMRNAAVQVVVGHIKDLSKNKWIQDLIRDEGEFAVDLFQHISEQKF